MKVSLNWIKLFIDISKTPSEIEQLLTATGLEVEHFEEVFSVKGGLKGLLIGKVVACQKHPNADKLSLTKVDVGLGEPLSIVCGAPNVAEGQKVVVATVGSTIYPTSGEPFTIQKAKIRGEQSEGMICAEDEIGLGNSHDGIIVLPDNATIGQLASEYYQIESDVLFEIGLTANRGDAASQMGVARELSTVLNLPLKFPEHSNIKSDFANPVTIQIDNHTLCPRYSAVAIENIKISESPKWMKNLLETIGVKSINNIVDVTNFVLHELGQPLHAFDLGKIKHSEINVKTATKNDKFIALDGNEYKLNGTELMICDSHDYLCIAGVYGGINSGVNVSTNSILLESAYFSPDIVRKSAKHHAINTDSSYRFERGTDPEMTVKAIQRTVFLLQSMQTEPLKVSTIRDIYPEPLFPFKVELRLKNILKIAGIDIPKSTIEQILTSLGIEINEQTSENVWQLSVPRFKGDVNREIDVIEELLRIYGLNQIPLKKHLQTSLNFNKENSNETTLHHLSTLLIGMGFNEIMTNSLTSDKYYEVKDSLVYLSNPLSKEMNVMRQSMLFSALESIAYNKNRKQTNTHFFEFGKTYSKTEKGFIENEQLIVISSGYNHDESWEQKQKPVDYYFLKSVVKRLADVYLTPIKKIEVQQVDSKTLQTFGIKDPVFYATIDWQQLSSNQTKKTFVLKDIPVFPAVRRDLSLVLDKSIHFKQVEDLIKKQGIKQLTKTNVFDIYEGKPLENNQKAMSISFEFYDETKTLTDAEIDPVMNGLMASFEQNIQAVIRK
jgi:phenylalanyl-tRNA synthetase beta chain